MVFEICAVIATLLFMLLTFFIIRTLLKVDHSLKNVDRLSEEIDGKMKQLRSTFKSVSHLGDVCEHNTKQLLEEDIHRRKYANKSHDAAEDLAELLLVGLKIGLNFLRR